MHEQAEAHAVGAVVLHEAQRIDAVAAALRHGLAVGGHDRRVDDDLSLIHIYATDTSDMRASETKSIAMTLPFSPLRERARFSSPL